MAKKLLVSWSVCVLLSVYLISGIGFSRHVCCEGTTRVALLLEQEPQTCGHEHGTPAEEKCCHTETYQFLPNCLAEEGVHCPDTLSDDLTLLLPPVCRELTACGLPDATHLILYPDPSDSPVWKDQAQTWSGQWRL